MSERGREFLQGYAAALAAVADAMEFDPENVIAAALDAADLTIGDLEEAGAYTEDLADITAAMGAEE